MNGIVLYWSEVLRWCILLARKTHLVPIGNVEHVLVWRRLGFATTRHVCVAECSCVLIWQGPAYLWCQSYVYHLFYVVTVSVTHASTINIPFCFVFTMQIRQCFSDVLLATMSILYSLYKQQTWVVVVLCLCYSMARTMFAIVHSPQPQQLQDGGIDQVCAWTGYLGRKLLMWMYMV